MRKLYHIPNVLLKLLINFILYRIFLNLLRKFYIMTIFLHRKKSRLLILDKNHFTWYMRVSHMDGRKLRYDNFYGANRKHDCEWIQVLDFASVVNELSAPRISSHYSIRNCRRKRTIFITRIKGRPIVPSGEARRRQTEYVTVDFRERRANDEYYSLSLLPSRLLAYEISGVECELQRYVRISTSKDNWPDSQVYAAANFTEKDRVRDRYRETERAQFFPKRRFPPFSVCLVKKYKLLSKET